MHIDGWIVTAHVNALAVFDDGLSGGPALYACGVFHSAGDAPAANVARWDGTSWTEVGGGIALGNFWERVSSLAVFDDGRGGGPALYAGGQFFEAGGVPCASIARWDGTSWSPVGGGVGPPVFGNSVHAMTVFDDGRGGGPALYAAGSFAEAGGVACNLVAKWDGAAWSPLGGGLGSGDGWVLALTGHDDGEGGGPALYAGGNFPFAGSTNLARWDGATWSGVGSGIGGTVHCLAGFDDGSDDGPVLFVGGLFDEPGSGLLTAWDGATWADLDGGLDYWKDEEFITDAYGAALTNFNDGSGSGRALIVGGWHGGGGGIGPKNLSKWVGCSPALEAWTDLGSGLPSPAFEPALAGTGTLLPGSIGALSLTNAPLGEAVYLLVSLSSTPTPFKGGTLIPVPPVLVLPGVAQGTFPYGNKALVWSDWPSGLPSGTTIDFQYVVHDPSSPSMYSLSNAIRATTP